MEPTMTPAEVKAYVNTDEFNAWPFRVRKSHPVLTGLFLELTRQF